MASPELSTLARSKLHSSVSGRESWNLHRWVLLKNSYHSTCIPSTAARTADITPVNIPNLGSEDVEEADDDDDMEVGDSFMFPDAGKLGEPRSSDINSPESQWLDSVLEGLGDDDDDEDYTTIASIRVSDTDLPAPEDEELLLSPLSPASSTDDLPGGQSSYFADSIPVTYPYIIPYPHFHPPLHRQPFGRFQGYFCKIFSDDPKEIANKPLAKSYQIANVKHPSSVSQLFYKDLSKLLWRLQLQA